MQMWVYAPVTGGGVSDMCEWWEQEPVVSVYTNPHGNMRKLSQQERWRGILACWAFIEHERLEHSIYIRANMLLKLN